MWVGSCDRNWYPIIKPATNVRNGFFRFFCRESTQINKYDQGLISKHDINRKNKQRKMFPFLLYFLFSPSIQERFCWFLPSPPVCRQWLHQPGFTIGPIWGRNISSPIRPYPKVPPLLICCGTGGLGVHLVHS